MNCGKPNVQPPEEEGFDQRLSVIKKSEGIYQPKGSPEFRVVTCCHAGKSTSFLLHTMNTENYIIPLDDNDWKDTLFKCMVNEKLFIGIGPAK